MWVLTRDLLVFCFAECGVHNLRQEPSTPKQVAAHCSLHVNSGPVWCLTWMDVDRLHFVCIMLLKGSRAPHCHNASAFNSTVAGTRRGTHATAPCAGGDPPPRQLPKMKRRLSPPWELQTRFHPMTVSSKNGFIQNKLAQVDLQ